MKLRWAAALVWTTSITACSLGEARFAARAPVSGRSTPRHQYEQREASHFNEVLREAWQGAGRRALRERLSIRPSFRELVFFDSTHAVAVGYHLTLRRGQRVTVQYGPIVGSSSGRLFAEVFEEISPPSEMFLPAFAADPQTDRFEFEARNDGEYVLRLQAALGESGVREVIVNTTATLTFPVREGTLQSVRSWFGDERDGGNRAHEGIDIFAARHTPVLAVADGVITTVQTTSVGGRVVWQRDELRNVSYYYAHLQSHSVTQGQRVRAGEAIGTVGNSGNASATSTHLHFGVYRPGQIAIDPVPFLYEQPGDPVSPVNADVAALGRWVRIDGTGVHLLKTPSSDAPSIRELPLNARVQLTGAVRDWYRVALEDGTTGFLGDWQVVGGERGR